jgi:hypothetical protein
VNLDELSNDERMAFFLNIYNALIIHGYLLCGVPDSSSKKILFYQVSRFHKRLIRIENKLPNWFSHLLTGWFAK